MKLTGIFFLCFFFPCTFYAQPAYRRVAISTTTVGVSAISLNTLTARSFVTGFPIYDEASDSLSGLFFFSIRQQSDDGKEFLNKAFIGAIDGPRDTVRWYSESNTFDIEKRGTQLYFSSPAKTNKINPEQGFEEAKYASRLLAAFPTKNRGLVYVPAGSEAVSCVNLNDGAVFWSAAVSGAENWVDTKAAGKDSLLIVAASGLSALHYSSGLQWTFPLITTQKVDSALTYSPADNNKVIRNISRVIATSSDAKTVTELSSNILTDDDGAVWFASKEKMIAVSAEGKLLWELDLKAYPVSKMCLRKSGGTISLLNFGLAKCADSYVNYGKAFVMSVDASNGKVGQFTTLDSIVNLVDVKETAGTWLLATRTKIVQVDKSSCQAQTILALDVRKYGSFAEFMDGDNYYTEKENFYVPLNFINDNPLYFRADNNKIYGLTGDVLTYEYHFNEIYKRELSFSNKLLLRGEQRSLIISKNMELLATLDQSYKGWLAGDRVVLVAGNRVLLLPLSEIK